MQRNVAMHLAREPKRFWEVFVSEDLTSKTLGIVGLGGIGAAAARVAKAFGMRVLGLRRKPSRDPNVDAWFGPEGLHSRLAESHYVVLSLPLTNETRGLMGAEEFLKMRDDAVLINVARGPVVNEEALIHALAHGVIKGASLDVTEIEPLPPDSPLWSLPNCTITPHDAGYSPLSDTRLGELFLDNLGRYVRGDPLRNEIRETGLDGGQ
jgi:phosphoglycerate dehydrogenase-like enzyme